MEINETEAKREINVIEAKAGERRYWEKERESLRFLTAFPCRLNTRKSNSLNYTKLQRIYKKSVGGSRRVFEKLCHAVIYFKCAAARAEIDGQWIITRPWLTLNSCFRLALIGMNNAADTDHRENVKTSGMSCAWQNGWSILQSIRKETNSVANTCRRIRWTMNHANSTGKFYGTQR